MRIGIDADGMIRRETSNTNLSARSSQQRQSGQHGERSHSKLQKRHYSKHNAFGQAFRGPTRAACRLTPEKNREHGERSAPKSSPSPDARRYNPVPSAGIRPSVI